MNGTHHERIRQRAHEIWEEEGRPDGKHEEHWRQAAEELGLTEEDGSEIEAPEGAPGVESSPEPASTDPSSSRSGLGSAGNGGGGTAGRASGNAKKA